MSDYKECPDCKCLLPKNQFYKNKASSNGMDSICKGCRKNRVNENYAKTHPRKHARNSKTHKWCPCCEECKPHNEFHILKGKRRRLHGYCLMCQRSKARKSHANRSPEARRAEAYKRNYGITLDDYNHMLIKQKGKCKICGTDQPGGNGQHFSVDHDHSTGKIRGLLCQRCNQGLGLFLEDPKLLNKAILYLKIPETGEGKNHDKALV